jgi:hypothetical protein
MGLKKELEEGASYEEQGGDGEADEYGKNLSQIVSLTS